MNLVQLRRGPHTSISRLKEYLTCPRRYFLKYERKVRPDFRPAALALGTVWHAAVDEWLTSDATAEELVAQLRDHLHAELQGSDIPVLFDDEGEDEARYIDVALKMFRTFVSRMKKPEHVTGVEVPFALELAHPRTGEVLESPVIGAIDAIVSDDGRPTIWELKTAARRWSTEQVEGELQATLYLYAARERGFGSPALQIVVTTKAVTPIVQIATVDRGESDVRELIETFFSVARAIAAGVDHPVRSWMCKSCPYARSCR